MVRQVLAPLITAYAVFVAMVALARRRPVPRPPGRAAGTSPGDVVRTIVGGYVAFLAIVLVFHVWLAEDPGAFASAVGGGAFLVGIALVAAVGSSVLARRLPRPRRR